MPAGSRRAVVGIIAALAAVGGQTSTAAPAYAAPAPGTAEVVAGQLVYIAGVGVDNQVEFFFNFVTTRWHVRDYAAPIIAGPGCAQGTSTHEVSCVGVTSIHASTLDGDDTLGVREKASPTSAGQRAAVPVPPTTPAPSSVPMVLLGGAGDDKLTGGWSDDLLDGGPGADIMVDWAGNDTVSYANRRGPVVADLDGAVRDDGERGEGDTIDAAVENLVGGAGSDTLVGNAGSNLLRGGPGSDLLVGLGGSDRLYGDADFDTLDGGSDRDICLAGADGGRAANCEATDV